MSFYFSPPIREGGSACIFKEGVGRALPNVTTSLQARIKLRTTNYPTLHCLVTHITLPIATRTVFIAARVHHDRL